jgi:hypothetical protein
MLIDREHIPQAPPCGRGASITDPHLYQMNVNKIVILLRNCGISGKKAKYILTFREGHTKNLQVYIPLSYVTLGK